MASRAQFSSKSPTIRRILREASELSTTPSADYTATPLDDNLFEWHFTLRGPPGDETLNPNNSSTKCGPYNEGIYHGRIVLPPTYPLRPPSFRFMTPSGRFETNREICLSISGHHEETWQPAWGLRTALVALRTFMETDAKGQLGGLECSDDMRRRMARQSRGWKCTSCGRSNEEILKESEEAAKASDSKADDFVPKELSMGWKDEMAQRKEKAAESKRIEPNDAESAELAEGFVQTAPMTSDVSNAVPPPPSEPTYPPARPAQSVSQPTATRQQSPNQPALAVQQRVSNDGVPAWVDKAIVGLVFCLVVMVLKVLLGI